MSVSRGEAAGSAGAGGSRRGSDGGSDRPRGSARAGEDRRREPSPVPVLSKPGIGAEPCCVSVPVLSETGTGAEPKHSPGRIVSVRKRNGLHNGLKRAGLPSVGPVRSIRKRDVPPGSGPTDLRYRTSGYVEACILLNVTVISHPMPLCRRVGHWETAQPLYRRVGHGHWETAQHASHLTHEMKDRFKLSESFPRPP